MIGFCVSGGLFSLFSVAAAGYPPSLCGTGAGVALAWARLGAILGPLLGGGMLQAQVPMTWIMGMFAALALATALLVFLAGAILRPATETATGAAAPKAR
jgi:MFS transporter, AAHS family, 4-hydroxybenzoate transporter